MRQPQTDTTQRYITKPQLTICIQNTEYDHLKGNKVIIFGSSPECQL